MTPPEGHDRAALRAAALAQLGGLAFAAALATAVLPDELSHPLAFAAVQGVGAAAIALAQRAPPWWLAIHAGFLPLAVVASRLALPPWLWLGGFVLLLLVFWRTDRSRVPLFLSSAETRSALAGLLPGTPAHVLDLGCGDGALLAELARARPDCRFVGYEHAPLPWLWARLRCRRLPNVSVRLGDFWPHALSPYDLVYAFLSPAPMERLWAKAAVELRPGALLVSNSFAVPGATAERMLELQDRRRTRLYCYRPAG